MRHFCRSLQLRKLRHEAWQQPKRFPFFFIAFLSFASHRQHRKLTISYSLSLTIRTIKLCLPTIFPLFKLKMLKTFSRGENSFVDSFFLYCLEYNQSTLKHCVFFLVNTKEKKRLKEIQRNSIATIEIKFEKFSFFSLLCHSFFFGFC